MYELDNDIEKQNAILALESDCEKYFASSSWNYFKSKSLNRPIERPSLVLAKNILAHMDTELVNTKISVTTDDNKKTVTSKYVLINK